MNTAIIFGSSRDGGNTGALCEWVANEVEAEIFYLSQYNILPFDYAFENKNDDFLALITTLLTFDCIIFATPIYWYSPSAQMKTFLERLSDLLTLHKLLGRQLREKSCALISTGFDKQPPTCFEDIFRLTFNYLGMEYKGMLYCECENRFDPMFHETKINSFVQDIYISIGNDKAMNV
jgi:multimeric flavodoxin WrbA